MTETVTASGVVPPADADNQLPPEVVEALVVKVMAAPLLVVLNVCDGADAPPLELKVKEVGDTDIVGLETAAGVSV